MPTEDAAGLPDLAPAELANLYFRLSFSLWPGNDSATENSSTHMSSITPTACHLLPTWNWIDEHCHTMRCNWYVTSAQADGERDLKTRLASDLPKETSDFLRLQHRSNSTVRTRHLSIGTRPSRKAVRRLLQRVHDATTPHKHAEDPELRVVAINRLLRGWAEVNQPRAGSPDLLAVLVNGVCNDGWSDAAGRESGHRIPPVSGQYLYETLGLFALPAPIALTGRRRREFDAGESRMREICMSGLTSGDVETIGLCREPIRHRQKAKKPPDNSYIRDLPPPRQSSTSSDWCQADR